MTDYTTPDGVMKRLKRIETKLTRGFEELGVGIEEDPDWLTVVGDTIEVNTMNRSIKAIIETAKQRGAKIGDQEYVLVYRGKDIAWL